MKYKDEMCLTEEMLSQSVGRDILINEAKRQQAIRVVSNMSTKDLDIVFATSVYDEEWAKKVLFHEKSTLRLTESLAKRILEEKIVVIETNLNIR